MAALFFRLSTLRRLRFILAKIILFGGGVLVRRMGLLPLLPGRWRPNGSRAFGSDPDALILACDQRLVVSPRKVRELLETLGPTFVKLGQVLSLRPDLVGPDLSTELSGLQSQVAPFPFEKVTKIIGEELGRPPDRVFAYLAPVPVGSASLAQVHRARLIDGTEVAVKVQRPGIRKVIEEDIRILRFLARLAHRFIAEIRPYSPEKVIEEFADWAERELDFSVEGHNAERFRFAFRANDHIKIPGIYWELTTSHMLTMEFIEGLRADDLPGMDEKGLDRKALALYGVDAQLQQFLLDGFFHGDPHPGNSFALEGNVLCFYDFGIVGYITGRQRRELLSCFVAFADQDIEGFLKHFLHLCERGARGDINTFYRDASAILAEIFYSPTSSSLAWVFFRLINRAGARGIQVPADLALFGKALITTEAMGKTLYPEFDFARHLIPFVARAFETYLDPARIRRSLTADFFDWTGLLEDLPARLEKATRKEIPDTGYGTAGHAAGLKGFPLRAAFLGISLLLVIGVAAVLCGSLTFLLAGYAAVLLFLVLLLMPYFFRRVGP